MFLVVLILVQKLKCDPAEDVPDRPVLAPLSTQDNCGSFNLSAHVNKYVHYFFMYICILHLKQAEKTAGILRHHHWVGKECRNSIPMMHHYPDLDSAPDWMKQIQPIRSITLIWVMIWEVMHHQFWSLLRCHFMGNQQWWTL